MTQCSSSARHTLFIEEILRVVLDHIPGWQFREKQATLDHIPIMDVEASRTLAYLARVCKAFSEPALDLLWKDLYDLEHLLRLLPAFKIKSEKRNEQYFCFNGIVTDQEWAHMMTYARRVRRYQHFRRRFDVSVFERLAQLCTEGSLLPSLQELRWTEDGPPLREVRRIEGARPEILTFSAGGLPYLRTDILLFISPTLRLLSWREDRCGLPVAYPNDCRSGDEEHSLAIFRKLADQAIGLEVLNIPLVPKHVAFWDILRQFPNLNTLLCTAKTFWASTWEPFSAPASFMALATIPSLRSLDICADPSTLIPRSFTLKSLEVLKLDVGTSGEWMARFFSAVSAPRLRSLSTISAACPTLDDDNSHFIHFIHLNTPTSPTLEHDNSHFMQLNTPTIASKFAGSLREVYLEHKTFVRVPHRMMVQTLLPLLELPKLTRVTFHISLVTRPRTESVQTLTDDDIYSMAIAWPHLCGLSIKIDDTTIGSVFPGISCLQVLARLCPNLRTLTLPIMPALPAVGPPLTELGDLAEAHPLEKMSLRLTRFEGIATPPGQQSPPEFTPLPGEVESIAHAIHNQFPSLNLAMCLASMRFSPRHKDPVWEDVVEAIALLQDPGGREILTPRQPHDTVYAEDDTGANTWWPAPSPLSQLPFMNGELQTEYLPHFGTVLQ